MNIADPPLRVGIVGCGSFARNAYARNVADHPDARLVALCDVDRGRAEAVAREFFDDRGLSPRPAIYSDYRQMIEKESLDVVMVGTLANVRPAVTLAALNAGAHVLAAKPMAPSLTGAEEMLRAAERAGRLLMVGYNFRFREDAQAVHRFIRSGGLGAPLFARAWFHEAGVPTWGPHYVKALSAGGSLASSAVHVIDLAVWYLGCPPLLSVEGHVRSRFADLPSLPPHLEAVRSAYDAEDLATGYARFADGVALSVEGMWLTPPQIEDKGVDVWGTKGYASLSPLRLLTWQDGDYADRTEEIAPGLAASFRDDSTVRNRREAFHFIDCALGRAEPLITPEEMWTDQAIVEGIYAGRLEIANCKLQIANCRRPGRGVGIPLHRSRSEVAHLSWLPIPDLATEALTPRKPLRRLRSALLFSRFSCHPACCCARSQPTPLSKKSGKAIWGCGGAVGYS